MLYLAACVYRPFRVMLSPSKMQRKITAMLEIVETQLLLRQECVILGG